MEYSNNDSNFNLKKYLSNAEYKFLCYKNNKKYDKNEKTIDNKKNDIFIIDDKEYEKKTEFFENDGLGEIFNELCDVNGFITKESLEECLKRVQFPFLDFDIFRILNLDVIDYKTFIEIFQII